MDRKIVVLTPQEWKNRTGLSELLQLGRDQIHFSITKVGLAKVSLYGLKHSIENGSSLNEIEKEINDLMILINQANSDLRRAQEIVTGVNTVIEYYPKET